MNPVFRLFRSKFYIALMLIFLVLCVGVLGYMAISGYGLIDALYMTVITVTTVGYRELATPDDSSKIFTIFLIITSVFVFAYSLSVITEYILGKNTALRLRKKKLKKKVESIKDHVIICGFGRNGKQAASKLEAYQRPYVAIENDKEIIERYRSEVTFIEGNANDDEVLEEAGINRASTLISALPSDADNLFVVLSARQLNKDLTIISRASEESSQSKLKLAGANNVIMPDKIGGDHMASLVVVPDLIEFMDNLALEGENSINLEEISMKDISEDYANKSIRDLDLRRRTGCTVIGYKEGGGTYVVNPEADTKLSPRSKLIVLGRPEQIQKLNALFNI